MPALQLARHSYQHFVLAPTPMGMLHLTTCCSAGNGLALSTQAEIEVRAGDRLIWTTNNRELGISNGSPVDVLRINYDGLTLRDATATRTLAPDNPLRENLAYGLVLNMHRAQGMTVDRAITVMDSHDRLLNSKSLYYVLSSRARQHLSLHINNRAGLVDAVGCGERRYARYIHSLASAR